MNTEIKTISSMDHVTEMQHAQLPVYPGITQGRQGEVGDLKGAAREFEAYFISHLLKVMRETVPKGALENKDGAYFYSFYDQEIARLASEAGGIGLAKMIDEYTGNMSLHSSIQSRQPIL
jgi:peptidoglycan hydrolase FlgJ